VEKGCDHTHTSFARPAGAFYIPASQQPHFFSLYRAALGRGEDLYLTEKHRHVGPVVVDLDFRFEPSAEEAGGVVGGGMGAAGPNAIAPARRHTDAVVADIVRAYAHHVAAFVQTPGEFEVLVQEKSAPTMFKGLVKDGLHLIMPSIVTRPEVQHMVRTAALPALTDALRTLALANRMEDVVDEAVIERNNWMMYGSKKPHGEAYVVTRAYVYSPATGDLRVQPLPGCLAAAEWVEPLSIRNKHDEAPVREAKQAAVSDYITQVEERRRRKEAVQAVLSSAPNARSNTCDTLPLVERLVDILSVQRAESYDEWVRVGWCLRNVDHRLLDKWIEFSKRSSKYIDGECPRLWNSMRQGGLGVGTLHMWARQDSPDAYREILRTDLKHLVLRCLSGTHHDMAQVVHHMYRYDYVCASLRNRQWYEFRDHRWRESDSACSLRKRICSDVFKEYLAIVGAHVAQGGQSITDDVEQEQFGKMCTKLTAVATQLKRVNFKENVMKECCEMFYVEKFEEMLDANLHLIGFENGVYDLQRHEFREGRPDDYVSNSTHINYVPYCEDHPTVREIHRFYEQVHPDKEVREYVLRSLASALSGVIREERFNIWTGCGSNGKSINVSLMEKAFGDYCCKFPVTLLTQKRAASNAATSEIARAKGKRFAVLQEPSEDERLNIGLMKELSGGDTIMARQLYREPVEFKPQFKMWLLCNQLPQVPSDDGGTWRRIRVVEFGSKFCDSPTKDNEYPIDLELPQKLEGWREHFMAMLIDYHRRFATVKLDEPEAVMACTRDYQRNNDHMADFVDSCLERVPARVGTPEDQLPVLLLDDAFAELKDWVRRDNIPFRVGKRNDIKAYLDRALGRCTPLGRGRMGWRGVRMRCIDEDDDGGALG
jgi:P4 family phage/plasmid primase-like protien